MMCRKIPLACTAIKWDGKNLDDVHEFCGNERVTQEGSMLFVQLHHSVLRVYIGNMLIKEGDHLSAYSYKEFLEQFEIINEKLPPDYADRLRKQSQNNPPTSEELLQRHHVHSWGS